MSNTQVRWLSAVIAFIVLPPMWICIVWIILIVWAATEKRG